jgi:hypothetical protein
MEQALILPIGPIGIYGKSRNRRDDPRIRRGSHIDGFGKLHDEFRGLGDIYVLDLRRNRIVQVSNERFSPKHFAGGSASVGFVGGIARAREILEGIFS